MNTRILILFTYFILLFSCKAGKHINYSSTSDDSIRIDTKNEDYTKSAKEAIDSILRILDQDTVTGLQINIYNFHGGVYTQKSKLTKKNDKINISTAIVGMDGKRSNRDTSFKTEIFIAELNKLAINAETQIAFAGNFQKIIIKYSGKELVFATRRAWGLISLL